MIYSWICVCIVTLAVAYSLAEMCSAYPVSGGQYSWVALLAPPKIARGLSWVTGWFMIVGVVAMGATNNFITANFALGMANLSHPEYVIERWHTVLVSWLVGLLAAGVNICLPRLLNKISTAALCWNILTFFVVIITILSTNDHKQSSSFVWKVSTAAHCSLRSEPTKLISDRTSKTLQDLVLPWLLWWASYSPSSACVVTMHQHT